MAYLVNQTNGALLATVLDGAVDRSHAGIALIGKQVANYGEIQNENLVRLAENFSNSTAPANPVTGQLWWNSATSNMQVFDGTAWRGSFGITPSATAPLTPKLGDQWWDSTRHQYYLYDGTKWVLIGPAFSALDGKAGPIVDNVLTSAGATVAITKFYANDAIIAVLNGGPAFTPAVAIPGFSTIPTGSSFSTLLPTARFNGVATNALLADTAVTAANADTAANAELFGGFPPSHYVAAGTPFNGPVTFSTSGFAVGSLTLLEDDSTPVIQNTVSDTIVFKAVVDGALTATVKLVGLDIVPAVTDVSNLGTVGKKFNSVHAASFIGVSASAQYADLAEKYLADADYEPGTVITVGGANEVTAAKHGDLVIGVVSTDPAFKMNSELEGGTYIALKGRVPVKVIGQVKKGDKLVAANHGCAAYSEFTTCAVFALALADSIDGQVECVLL